ncbi:MAG TPA: nucleotide exchange factor GrpE [Melioribacteraceae bacterium]|nr:nucleotide exchange factor GrpE [Melioribacteraceae bacterium]
MKKVKTDITENTEEIKETVKNTETEQPEIKEEPKLENTEIENLEVAETSKYEEEIKTLNEKIKALELELGEAKDKRLRTLAEFENYKKRAQNELSDFFKYSSESMIKKILPIYDDLSRSFSHVPDELVNNSFVNGVKMVFDKFTKILTEEGVKKIETTGRQFDFNFHEALLQQPNNQVPNDQILQEIEAGYIYKDKVIRHAKVIVCVNNETNKEVENNEGATE